MTEGVNSMAQHENAPQKTIIAWLNDAYAMENSLINTLEGHAKDAKSMPQLNARIQQHIEETRRHAELVKGCIERLGGDTSTLKTGMAKMMGAMQGVSTSVMGAKEDDTLVKNGLADYSAEQFEVASYKALMVAAQAAGDQGTALVAEEIMREDAAMAQWLDQNLPMVVEQTLMQHAAA
jgi:ferritin-like metal-binding protein YciE